MGGLAGRRQHAFDQCSRPLGAPAMTKQILSPSLGHRERGCRTAENFDDRSTEAGRIGNTATRTALF